MRDGRTYLLSTVIGFLGQLHLAHTPCSDGLPQRPHATLALDRRSLSESSTAAGRSAVAMLGARSGRMMRAGRAVGRHSRGC
jgi:hypothetical protein